MNDRLMKLIDTLTALRLDLLVAAKATPEKAKLIQRAAEVVDGLAAELKATLPEARIQ